MKIDLSRPDIVFFVVWSIPLILLQFFSLQFFIDISIETILLISCNIISFFLIYSLVRKSVKNKLNPEKCEPKYNISKTKDFFKQFFIIWVTLYLITIIFSSGIPVYWILSGSSLTYSDFGIPTLSGFLNMIRAFLCVISFIVFMKTNERKYFLFILFFLFTAFIFEANRGGGLVLLLHVIGYYFLIKKITFKKIIKLSGLAILLMVFLTLIEIFRYTNNSQYDFSKKYADIELFGDTNRFSIFLIPAIIYTTTPLQNLNYTIIENKKPLYYPYYSTLSLIPTVLRNKIFSLVPSLKTDWGSLLSDTYNTTTFYVPFLRDFGKIITLLIIFFIQFIVSYVHVKSKYSSILSYRLLYPPLFMCVVLSPFNLYFTSLIVVAYPIILHMFIHYKKIVLNY